MFSISKQSFRDRGKTSSTEGSRLGSTSKQLFDKKFKSESALSPSPLNGTNINNNQAIQLDTDPLLYNMGPGQAEESLYRVYRDMYLVDPIAGSCADLMSNMPFSEFTLGGIASKNNKQIEQKFQDSLERLNVKTMLPEAALDYLVMGRFTNSILLNSKKEFVDFMVHDAESVKVTKLPFYSQDPILTVKFPNEIKKALESNSPRIAQLKEMFGADIFSKIAQGELELDPLSTIHVARKTRPNCTGVSWFHRALPIYLFEKNLYRGTLVESARRQRGIMHITVGDGDEWVPTPADYDYVSELFTNADADPLGAIVTTRPGIMIDEIRQGGDFWKVTDVWDSTTNFKLKALGVGESFLSGDSNVDTTSNNIMVFLEQLKTFRDTFTRKFFYNKIFPLISLVNGYTVKDGKISIDNNLLNSANNNIAEALSLMNDSGKLLVPTVQWAKHFKPEGDQGYLDMLQSLSEKGVPVPIRALAAAGGFNIDKLISETSDDLEVRDRAAEAMQKIAELKSKYGATDAEASESAEILAGSTKASAKSRGSIPLTSRFNSTSESAEVVGKTRTGKKKYIHNQKDANEKANKTIAKSLTELKKKGKI